jgi:bacillithiol biosynthesis deacetylase BshB1
LTPECGRFFIALVSLEDPRDCEPGRLKRSRTRNLRLYNEEVPGIHEPADGGRISHETERLPVSLDLLAIAAHPDDVEQTCGGTLIAMGEKGYRTGVLDLTAGDMGTRGTPEQRVAESAEAGKQLRLRWRGNLYFPDARLENTISARMTLAVKIRELRPRVVILPYWEGRHPDHYRAAEIGYEACFLAGLKKLDPYTEPHRPHKVIYSSLYADVKPSFVVDISSQFERRMAALLSYRSQYGAVEQGSDLFPQEQEIRERLGAVARFYGNLIGVRYGEPFVVKETMKVDDVVTLGPRSL